MKQTLQIVIFLIALFTLQSFTPHLSMGDTTVYIVSTGKVYHSTKSCRGLKNTKHKIKAVSIKEAQKNRRPCKICY
jgi:ribosomal protein L13